MEIGNIFDADRTKRSPFGLWEQELMFNLNWKFYSYISGPLAVLTNFQCILHVYITKLSSFMISEFITDISVL